MFVKKNCFFIFLQMLIWNFIIVVFVKGIFSPECKCYTCLSKLLVNFETSTYFVEYILSVQIMLAHNLDFCRTVMLLQYQTNALQATKELKRTGELAIPLFWFQSIKGLSYFSTLLL